MVFYGYLGKCCTLGVPYKVLKNKSLNKGENMTHIDTYRHIKT